MITLLSGDIRSGKTTTLMNWSEHHSASGFLTPDRDGNRVIYSVSDGSIYPFQTELKDEVQCISIGKFHFLKSGFERCRTIVAQTLSGNARTIIIDEIGPLELRGLGHDQLVREFIREDSDVNWILVVRSNLIEQVISHYGWKTVEIRQISNFLP